MPNPLYHLSPFAGVVVALLAGIFFVVGALLAFGGWL